MSARKPLKETLAEIDREEKESVEAHAKKAKAIATKYRVEAILKAPYAQLLEAGIESAADHPDVKAFLATKQAPTAAAGEGGKRKGAEGG